MKVTLKKAKSLLASVEHTEANRTPIDAVKRLIASVENDTKNESILVSVPSLIKDAETLNSLNTEISELRTPTEKKSRAADMAKSRANAAGYIRDARLTERAAKSLENLCSDWNMNKTQVINKLLEEQEQRQLL